jgi:dsDNA-specific endonuclease/ATPase MutS2
VKNFFDANMDKLGLFSDLMEDLVLPDVLVEVFKDAFDDDGNLNAEKYKELGKLRRQSATLRARIIQTIETLLRSQDMKEKIADNGYTEMDGRYCLMLKNTYKKGVGIVHGSSNTGRLGLGLGLVSSVWSNVRVTIRVENF